MKVYEKLGLPYLTEEQYRMMDSLHSPKCGNEGVVCEEDCMKCTYKYLMSDVPMKKVKRWETYNRDFIKAFSDYLGDIHNAKHSPEIIGRNFVYWLMEEIEVEDD